MQPNLHPVSELFFAVQARWTCAVASCTAAALGRSTLQTLHLALCCHCCRRRDVSVRGARRPLWAPECRLAALQIFALNLCRHRCRRRDRPVRGARGPFPARPEAGRRQGPRLQHAPPWHGVHCRHGRLGRRLLLLWRDQGVSLQQVFCQLRGSRCASDMLRCFCQNSPATDAGCVADCRTMYCRTTATPHW